MTGNRIYKKVLALSTLGLCATLGFVVNCYAYDDEGDNGSSVQVKSSSIEREASLNDIEKDVHVSIGDQLVGTELNVTLIFSNNSQHAIDVSLIPSCGCTKPGLDQLALQVGEKLPLEFKLKVPNIEQDLAVSLNCIDAKLKKNFRIVIIGRVVQGVAITPKSIVRMSDCKLPIQVRIAPSFPSVEIDSVSLLSSGYEIVSSKGMPGQTELEVAPASKEFHESDRLVFSVAKRDGTSSILSAEMIFLDKVDVTPKNLILRSEGESLVGMIMVKGVGMAKFKDSLSLDLNSPSEVGEATLCSIEAVRDRSPEIVVVTFKAHSRNVDPNDGKSVLRIRGLNEYGPWEKKLLVSSIRK